MGNEEYGVVWSVPRGWLELSEPVVQPSPQTLYSRIWADQEEGAAIFSESPPRFPDGLMVLAIEVEPEDALPFPSSLTPNAIYWGGYDMEVYSFEVTGAAASPFVLRQGFVVLRSPYRYTLMLGCFLPQNGDIAQHEFLCRYTWTDVSYPFGLCPLQFATTEVSVDSWQQIRNLDYDYLFEVPVGLLEVESYPGLLKFQNDPAIRRLPGECPMPLPNGLVQLVFAADPPSVFGPGGRPDVEGYTETTMGDFPAWSKTTQGGEGLRPLDTFTELYIQGPEFWYTMRWTCRMPTNDSEDGQAEFVQQCQAMLDRILDSFQVLSP